VVEVATAPELVAAPEEAVTGELEEVADAVPELPDAAAPPCALSEQAVVASPSATAATASRARAGGAGGRHLGPGIWTSTSGFAVRPTARDAIRSALSASLDPNARSATQ